MFQPNQTKRSYETTDSVFLKLGHDVVISHSIPETDPESTSGFPEPAVMKCVCFTESHCEDRSMSQHSGETTDLTTASCDRYRADQNTSSAETLVLDDLNQSFSQKLILAEHVLTFRPSGEMCLCNGCSAVNGCRQNESLIKTSQ